MDKYNVPDGVVVSSTSKTTDMLRCWRCGKLLAELVTSPYTISCPRCKGKSTGK